MHSSLKFQKGHVGRSECILSSLLSTTALCNIAILLRSKIPSGMCAKLRAVATSNNRDHARNLSLRMLGIMFNRSHVTIGRASMSQSLLVLLARATFIMVLSSHTSCSWWITQSTQHHWRGCNSIVNSCVLNSNKLYTVDRE